MSRTRTEQWRERHVEIINCDRTVRMPVDPMEDLFHWNERSCRVGSINRELRFKFELDQADPRFPENEALIDTVVQFMLAMPTVVLEIGCHSDTHTRVQKSANFRFTELRAQAIINMLVEKGVAPSRLVASGYGDSQPLVSREEVAVMDRLGKEHAHNTNRRTEFKILRCE